MELPTNLGLTEKETAMLRTQWGQVQAASARFNLSAVNDAEAAEKHYRDCLAARAVLAGLPAGSRVLDLGSGAGFPGLALAAVCPDFSFTLLDATAKKCDFLREAAVAMGLSNVDVICGRAEDVGRAELRESFDLVTARAVASLRELVELALPLLKEGGSLLAYKGAYYQTEIDEAAHALSELCGEVGEVTEYTLAGGDRRALITVRKLAPTPTKYPRRPGMPHKRPL